MLQDCDDGESGRGSGVRLLPTQEGAFLAHTCQIWFFRGVTEAVPEQIKGWQSRPLDAVYPIVYPDALVVKVWTGGRVENRAVHVVIGMDRNKEVLGLWTRANEGAKFWLRVLTELKNRGLKDILSPAWTG